jgi:hypothetical protein
MTFVTVRVHVRVLFTQGSGTDLNSHQLYQMSVVKHTVLQQARVFLYVLIGAVLIQGNFLSSLPPPSPSHPPVLDSAAPLSRTQPAVVSLCVSCVL